MTGLRFFTVYGPWGRPDMAYFSFTHRIATGRPIEVYGHGAPRRDFTYIDDVVDGVVGALGLAAEEEIFNLGNHRSESLLHFIEARVATSSSPPPISPADSRDRTGDCGAEGGGESAVGGGADGRRPCGAGARDNPNPNPNPCGAGARVRARRQGSPAASAPVGVLGRFVTRLRSL